MDKLPSDPETRRRILRDPHAYLSNYAKHADWLVKRAELWRMGAPAGQLTLNAERDAPPAAPAMKIELAAIYAEAGNFEMALDLVVAARLKNPAALQQLRYIGLIKALGILDREIAEEFRSEIACTDMLLSQQGRLGELLANPARTVCIVGNSPSLVGSGKGGFIDGHDIVIRFNNFETLGYEADYGRRTDIWARAGRHQEVLRRENATFQHVAILGPPIYWRMRNGYQLLIDHAISGLTAEAINAKLYFDVALQTGSPPSSGLLMIWWVLHLRGSLDNVTLAGFDPGGQADGLKHYFATLPRRSEVPHAWDVEATVLQHWLATYGEVGGAKRC